MLRTWTIAPLLILLGPVTRAPAAEPAWVFSTAHAIPEQTHNQGSGYFAIIEGRNEKLYIGTAKYGVNSYLVEFDPKSKQMRVAVDVHKAIGTDATGIAAQSKIHTRNNVGESGKIYFATKQGYPEKGESFADYPGGYPMVYDPATDQTKVYPIPIPQHGIISITPDESRNLAYLSTCSDTRPLDSTHFLVLDLVSGKYRDLGDMQHMYAFIVVDYLGRAYHPALGGQIARYDPDSGQLEHLKQTIDGQPPTAESHLADPESHPINWDVTPDRQTLYAVAMSGNQLYRYDLTSDGDTLAGKSLGKLLKDATATDCRAMCVGPKGEVWAGVDATFEGNVRRLHLVTYRPGDSSPRDLGPIAIRNPDFTPLTDDAGKPLPNRHGVTTAPDGTIIPRYSIMGICQASNGKVYLTTLVPFTLHEIDPPQ